MSNLSATPGRYQTGSTAALLTLISTPDQSLFCVKSALSRGALFSTIFPSIARSPFLADSSISDSFIWAFVTAMEGWMSRFCCSR